MPPASVSILQDAAFHWDGTREESQLRVWRGARHLGTLRLEGAEMELPEPSSSGALEGSPPGGSRGLEGILAIARSAC